MTKDGHGVEFENERIRVIRVRQGERKTLPTAARGDRLVIYLRDGHVTRAEKGVTEEVRRQAGEFVWRPRSEHQVEVHGDAAHEVLIVELKS